MKLTSKGRYAVTAILDIAMNSDSGPVNLSDISERQHISLSYLEQLFARLRRQGLVKSVRGPGGGYQLGMPKDKISVGMVIGAVNENINVMGCSGQDNCKNGGQCLTHTLWNELSQRIASFLDEITLADLVEQHRNPHQHCNHQNHKDFENLAMINN